MKLTFETGTMSSGKTLHLLSKHYELTSRGIPVTLMTPSVDTRYGLGVIRSKAGIQRQADHIINPTDGVPQLLPFLPPVHSYILVDEAQFLSTVNVEALRKLADDYDSVVFCYGIRTDFEQRLFEGSKRLLELADDIKVHHSMCKICLDDSTFNLRLDTEHNNQILLGGDETYAAVCSTCYNERN